MELKSCQCNPVSVMYKVFLFLLVPTSVVTIKLWTGEEESSFLHSRGGTTYLKSSFPTVNKCCPLGERWRAGRCVSSIYSDTSGSPSDQKFTYDSTNFEDFAQGSSTYDGTLGNNAEVDPTSQSISEGPIVFRLRVSMPNCSSSKKLIEKIIHKEVLTKERMVNATQVFNLQHTGQEIGPMETSVFLSTEGHLIWKDHLGFLNTHTYTDFCIDQINDTSFVALICEPRCDETQPCIRKCCSPGSILDIDNEACVVSRNEWNPYLYNGAYTPVLDFVNYNPHYVIGIPECDSYPFSPRQDPEDKMYILTNGSLVTITRGRKIVYPLETFCVDGAVTHQPHSQDSLDHHHREEPHEPIYYSGSELDQIAIICYPPAEAIIEKDFRYGLYAKCELVSSFFLILTASVYLILWEYQNIHGWLQFAYVVSCFFSFTFLAIAQLFSNEIHDKDQNLCESMGAVIHFSFLAAFFWLTSMNFDLWWTFSGCRPLRPRSKTGDKKRFFIFAIFSWGFPGIIAGIGLVLDYIYKDQPDTSVTRPRFGERKCYFYGSEEQLPYFYGPVGFLLLIDLIFFVNTVYSLQKLQKDTKFATRQSSKQDKKRFVLFMKIFIVMGVLWIFEVISWIVEVYGTNENIKNAFVFFDVVNALQGFWIFIIFTCKPNTCRQLEGKFKKLSLLLEKYRDQDASNMTPNSTCRSIVSCIIIGFCTVILPIVHCFRRIFNLCGHRSRSLDSRRTRSNTTTVTSGTFDKSRKFSECSTASTYTTTDPCSCYEMESKSARPTIQSI